MEIEITPEPTEEEREAIAAALSALPETTNGDAWWAAGLPADAAVGDDDEDL